MEIRGRTTAEVANKTVELILRKGSQLKRITGPWALHSKIAEQPMLELRNITLVVESPRARWNTRVVEGTCQEFLDYYLGLNPGYVHLTGWKFYDRWRNTLTGRYPYTYGERVYGLTETNQWRLCVANFKKNLTTRHCSISIWRPEDLFGSFVPCALLWHFQVNEKRELEMTCVMRSQDAFLGLFLDLFAYTHFHEIMAGELGLKLGAFTQFQSNVHIYKKRVGHYKMPLVRDPPSYSTNNGDLESAIVCKPLRSREKVVLLKTVKAWYDDRKPSKASDLMNRLPNYWKAYLSFQFLDRQSPNSQSSVDSTPWKPLWEHLTPEMRWILGRRGK